MITKVIQDIFSKKTSSDDSTKEYFSYDSPAGHFKRNQDKYLIGGGALIGGATGYKLGKKRANRKAKEKGLTPGTQDHKKFIRNQNIKNTAIGTLVGAGVGVGATYGKHMYDINHHSKKTRELKEGDIIKVTRKGKPQAGQHYAVYAGKGRVIHHEGDGIKTDHLNTLKNYYEEGTKVKIESPKNKVSRKEMADRLRLMRKNYHKGKYHMYKNNCEHFARELTSGKRFSTQSDGIMGKIGSALGVH